MSVVANPVVTGIGQTGMLADGSVPFTGAVTFEAGLVLNNTQALSSLDFGGSTVSLLSLDGNDDLNIGDITDVDEINISGSAGILNIVGPAGANNIVEIQAAVNRSSALRLAGIDINHPFTSIIPSDVYAEITSVVPAQGGLRITGASDVGQIAWLTIGLLGDASPPASTPVMEWRAGKTDGATGAANLAATETAYVFANSDASVDYLTITGSGAQSIITTATTQDGFAITANALTTGNIVSLTHAISADGLTARTAANTFFDLTTSRTETRTSGTTADDYDVMSLSRTSVTTGSGGTLTSAGSVLKLENTVTQTDGTLTDSVNVLEIVQDVDSSGAALSMNMLTADNGFMNFVASEDPDATSALSSLTTAGATQGFVQVRINTSETGWLQWYADPSA